jgi:NTP pyrophosphatase (non-canonical NTP hydrolase)
LHDLLLLGIDVGNKQDRFKRCVFYGQARHAFVPYCAKHDKVEIDDFKARLVHCVLGLMTEAAELQQQTYDFLYLNKGLDIANIIEEIGDSLWYAGILADMVKQLNAGVTLEMVMGLNIAKLDKRYGKKFTEFAAQNRDVDEELTAIRNLTIPPKV